MGSTPSLKSRKGILVKRCAMVCASFLVILCFGYVATRDFSNYWQERLKQELQQHGLVASVGNLTLHPGNLVAHNLELKLLDAHHTQVLFVDRATLHINFWRIFSLHGAPLLQSIDLHDAQLTLPVALEDPEGPKLKLSHLQAHIDIDKDYQLTIRRFDGQWNKVLITASGLIQHPKLYSNLVAQWTQNLNSPEAQAKAIAHTREVINTVLQTLEQIHLHSRNQETSPQLNLLIDTDLAHFEASKLRCSLQDGHQLMLQTEFYPGYHLCNFWIENHGPDLTSIIHVLANLTSSPELSANLHSLQLQGAPELQLSGHFITSAPVQSLTFAGQFNFGHGQFEGVNFNHLDSTFEFKNKVGTWKNIHLKRDEGSGSMDKLEVDFNRYEVRLSNLKTSVFPSEIAIWIDPDLVDILKPYRFVKPPQTIANGVVQFHGGRQSNLKVRFSTTQGLRYTFLNKELYFPKFSGQLRFTDDRLHLTNLRGQLFEGEMIGSLDLDLRKQSKLNYRASIEARNVEMVELTKLYFNYQESKGLLKGKYRWTGHGDNAASMKGYGHAEVAQGNVFSLPVFGPLSGLIPGFGYETAHEASADFTIANGKIYNSNLNIRSNGFSMLGCGWLGFTNDTMNYQVRMNAHGVIGTILYPISKLFQYSSVGPLHKPVWRPQPFEDSPLENKGQPRARYSYNKAMSRTTTVAQ